VTLEVSIRKISMKTTVIALAVIVVAIIVSVVVATSAPAGLRVATTTSLYDTGLWDDALEPIFEQRYSVDLQITVKGTGMALELGQRGDVDVVTVHDPLQEAAFIASGYAVEAKGYGAERVPWAYNYFIIVGPEADPAGISGLTPEEAF
jgi:ABC-type tungstate transport system, permease component